MIVAIIESSVLGGGSQHSPLRPLRTDDFSFAGNRVAGEPQTVSRLNGGLSTSLNTRHSLAVTQQPRLRTIGHSVSTPTRAGGHLAPGESVPLPPFFTAPEHYEHSPGALSPWISPP